MTISDDELAKWEARSRSTYVGLRNSVPVTQIIGELRDARRKLAAVEEAAERLGSIWNTSPKTVAVVTKRYPYLSWAIDHLAAALAAGEAPTEPATCEHGETMSHGYRIEGRQGFWPCGGPVPQGGTE